MPRPRSETSRTAILTAARTLVLSGGYTGVTIDEIASRAGVGKQTVYRWWPSKAAVVAEMVIEDGGLIPTAAIPVTDNIEADLSEWLGDWVNSVTSPEGNALLLAVTAAANDDKDVAEQLHDHFTDPHQRLMRERLIRGVADGVIDADASITLIADMLTRVIIHHAIDRDNPPTVENAHALVRLVLHGAGT
jgi:AcrR family transcriptional regulator